MPWLRSGDNAATHPIVMRVVSLVRTVTTRVLERDVAVNEVFGFVTRCALQSAGHTTDYVIDEGTAMLVGGARTERLLDLAIKAGYLTRARRKGVVTYLLIDEPEFLHMRTRAELERDRQRKHDNSSKAVIVPVRIRDGDECRYCGVIVKWNDRKSNRAGTYDHRNGLDQPAAIDTLVVACNACNGGRGDDPDADLRYPLRPAPTEPYYSLYTAAFLADAGHLVTPTEDPRPGSRPGPAHRDPAPSGTPHPATRQPAGTRTRRTINARTERPGTQPDTAGPTAPARPHPPPGSADPEHPGSGFAGTGRDGSGSAHSSPSRHADVPAAARRKRSPRGRTHPQRNGATP